MQVKHQHNVNERGSSSSSHLITLSRIFGILTFSSLSLLALSGLFFLSSNVIADNSAVDNITVSVPTSCTMGGVIESAHTTTLISGQSASDIGTTRINILCNDENGYIIYAVGSGNDEDGNTDLVSNTSSNYNIHTGLAMSGNTSAWAMKLTAGSGTGSYTDTTTGDTVTTSVTPPTIASDTEGTFSAYHTVPNEYKTVAYRQSATEMDSHYAATGSFIRTTYRIYTSSSQPAGTYLGKVKYAVLHPYTSTGPISLERAFYNAGKTKATALDGKQYYKLQDMNPTICSNVNLIGESSQTKLVDVRDSKTYYVAKLQDGNCWMTQNLDLDLASGQTLTSETTNLTTYGSAPYTVGYSCSNASTTTNCTASGEVISWTPQDWTATATSGGGTISATTRTPNASGNFDNWVNGTDASGADQYKDGFVHPLSADPGNYYEKGTYFNSANCYFLQGCTTQISNTPDVINGDHGHIGNYYNYTASIASNDSNGVNSGYQENSICPANWRLPKDGEYGTLNILYNDGRTGQTDPVTQGRDSGLFNAPLYLVRAGYVNGGTLNYPASNTYYWSGKLSSIANVYGLLFYSTNVNPSYRYNGRWSGFSVRCLANSAE